MSEGEDDALSDIRPEVVLQIFFDYDELKEKLFQFLESLMKGVKPNHYHFFLAEALRQGNFVFTTNYDQLIEEACKRNGIDYDVYYTNEHFDRFREDLKNGSHPRKGSIFKLHGSIESPESILAIVCQLGKGLYPSKESLLVDFLQNYNFCFIGYSCRDDFDILHALLNAPNPNQKGVLWFKYAKGDIGEIIWSKEILLNEKEKEENKPLEEEKDWETVNLNEFLLRRENFLKVIGDPGKFIREKYSFLDGHVSVKADSPNNEDESIEKSSQEISKYLKNLIAGRLYLCLEKFDNARDYFKRAIESSEDKYKKAIAQRWLAQSYYIAEKGYEEAIKILIEKTLPILEELKDALEIARVKIDVAQFLRRPPLNKFREALKYADEARILLENKKEEIIKKKDVEEYELEYARCLNILGLIYYQGRSTSNPLPDISKAIDLCLKGRRIREQHGDISAVADSENSIGLFYYEKANYLSKVGKKEEAIQILNNRSLRYLDEARRKKERVGDYRGLQQIYRNLGLLYDLLSELSTGEEKKKYLDEAARVYDQLANYMRRIKPPEERFLEVQYRRAKAYIKLQKHDKVERAIEILTEIIKKREKIGDWHGEARALDVLLQAYEFLQQKRECERCCDRLISVYQQVLGDEDKLKELKKNNVKRDNAIKEILPHVKNSLEKMGLLQKAQQVDNILKELKEKIMIV